MPAGTYHDLFAGDHGPAHLLLEVGAAVVEDGRQSNPERQEAGPENAAATAARQLVNQDQVVERVHPGRRGAAELLGPDGGVHAGLVGLAVELGWVGSGLRVVSECIGAQ